MTVLISCPQCYQPVDPQNRYCDHCGVDLALAAVVAEQLGKAMNIDSVPTMIVEGKYRVQGKGFEQLLANTDALIAMSRKK